MTFGFLVYPGVEELDFQGPWEIVGMWHKYAGGPKPVLVSRNLEPVSCAHGMRVLPDRSFSGQAELALTHLLVPGGFAAFDEMKRPELTDFVRRTFDAGADLLSVCSGSFILQAAGILEGRKASTNWKAIEPLRQLGVEVVEERYTQDGPVWTSAGVSAGIDMLLAYIAAVQGENVASTVQLHAEYFPEARVYGEVREAQPVAAYMQRL
jgi:transcriptional regulator GlxA family with amidase domain